MNIHKDNEREILKNVIKQAVKESFPCGGNSTPPLAIFQTFLFLCLLGISIIGLFV